MRLFEELKRRNVFRMAAVYVAVGWLLTQVAATLEGAIGLPRWFDGMVVALLVIGFPLALLFSWAFEITPDGVKRTADVDPGASATASAGRKLDYIFIAAAVLAVAAVAADRLLPRSAPADPAQAEGAAAPAASVAAVDDRSIAVLPFVDLSPGRDQEYFADGLSEELLNVLAQSQDLKVAGRTSSFAFKGQSRDLREVGEILNVSHILEGSVRKSGERIRVTAQLIKASDGYHVFSETYDRDLKDIFAVQDDIAGKIGAALKARLSGESATGTAPAALEAYDLYLLARQLIYTRSLANLREADGLLDRALALDPGYAPALAQKAILLALLSDSGNGYGDIPIAEAAAEARQLIDRALAAAPDLAEAHAAKGLLLIFAGAPFEEIEAPLKRALALNPSFSDAQNWLAAAYSRVRRRRDALETYEQIFERDPLFRPAFNNFVSMYASAERFDKTDAAIARVERIVGADTSYTRLARGLVSQRKEELADAATQFKAALDAGLSSNVLRLNYTSTLMQLGELETALDIAPAFLRPEILRLLKRDAEAKAEAQAQAQGAPASANVETFYPVFLEYAEAGRHAEAAAYIERYFGGVEKAAASSPSSVADWAGPLAASYKALGRAAEFETTLRLIEDSIADDRDMNPDSLTVLLPTAAAAALRGDPDKAVEALRRIVARGYADAQGFSHPEFDALRADSRFREMEDAVRERANAERAKLGLKPL